MAWSAYTDGARVRFLLAPEDEDLTGWTELELPDGFAPEAYPWVVSGTSIVHDLARMKTALRDRVRANRDAAEFGVVATPSGPIETNPESQRKLGGASTAALALGAAFSKEWRMADDSIVTLDAGAMIAVGLTVVAHVDACQQHKNALDAAIGEAATLAELDAIDIESGWPG